jgi:hypothetical protein
MLAIPDMLTTPAKAGAHFRHGVQACAGMGCELTAIFPLDHVDLPIPLPFPGLRFTL